MTLQEIPIETVDIVRMPPIKPCVKKTGTGPRPRKKVACPQPQQDDDDERERDFVLLSPIIKGT